MIQVKALAKHLSMEPSVLLMKKKFVEYPCNQYFLQFQQYEMIFLS